MEISSRFPVSGRLSGILLIGAAVIMAIGAVIGSLAPSLRDAPWTDDPRAAAVVIAGNPGAYGWANVLFLAAAILTAFGLVVLALRVHGRGRPWAWIGSTAFTFAAVFSGVARIISIQVFTLAGQPGFEVSGPTAQAFIRLGDGLGFAFGFLGFLAISLFGVALTLGSRARGLGWFFLIGGALGVLLRFMGGTIPAMIFLGTAALGGVTWGLHIPSEPDEGR